MRFFVAVLTIMLVSAVAEYFLPWWSVAIVALIIAMLMNLTPGKAFLAGTMAILLLWLAWSLWWDIPNDHLLSRRMARLFSLPGYSAFIAVTVFIGGIVGGLSAWSGAHLRRML